MIIIKMREKRKFRVSRTLKCSKYFLIDKENLYGNISLKTMKQDLITKTAIIVYSEVFARSPIMHWNLK